MPPDKEAEAARHREKMRAEIFKALELNARCHNESLDVFQRAFAGQPTLLKESAMKFCEDMATDARQALEYAREHLG